jgi:hypothetical protein
LLIKIIKKNALFRIIFGLVILTDLYFRSGSNQAGSFFYFGTTGSFIMMFALLIAIIFIAVDFILIAISTFKGHLKSIVMDAVVSLILVVILVTEFFIIT